MRLDAEGEGAARERAVGAGEAGRAAGDVPREQGSAERPARDPGGESAGDAEDAGESKRAVHGHVRDGRTEPGRVGEHERVLGADEVVEEARVDEHGDRHQREQEDASALVGAHRRDGDEERRDDRRGGRAEAERKQRRFRGQPRTELGAAPAEVRVRLLHADHREVRDQERHRGQESDVAATVRPEGARDDEHVPEREDGDEDIRAVGEERGRGERRPARRLDRDGPRALYHATVHSRSTAPAHAGHGWLAAVLPAKGRRLRVADAELAATLADAGAELVETEPEVEIGRPRGDAAVAVIVLGASPADARTRAGAVAGRTGRSAAVRLRAAAEAARPRRLGYSRTSVLLWDVSQPLRLGATKQELSAAERLPRPAPLVGRRDAGPTLLDAALEEAGAGGVLGWPSLREGLLVVPTAEAILRVAIGPARAEIEIQQRLLEALRRAAPGPAVEERVPSPLARGSTGPGEWSP